MWLQVNISPCSSASRSLFDMSHNIWFSWRIPCHTEKQIQEQISSLLSPPHLPAELNPQLIQNQLRFVSFPFKVPAGLQTALL